MLKIIPEKGKNIIVQFKDFHMQEMQPFMIIADFEIYRNKLNQIKPYSFVTFTHCIFDKNNNEVPSFTGENCSEKFQVHIKFHVDKTNKMKTRPNPYFYPSVIKAMIIKLLV